MTIHQRTRADDTAACRSSFDGQVTPARCKAHGANCFITPVSTLSGPYLLVPHICCLIVGERHSLWRLPPLLLLIKQCLAFCPCLPHFGCPRFTARRDFHREGPWLHEDAANQVILVR